MKYRDFEIRKTSASTAAEPRYELVKWFRRDNGEPPYCTVIAWIDRNPRECSWKFSSVGMRFIDYYETGLAEYVRQYVHILEMIWQDADKGE